MSGTVMSRVDRRYAVLALGLAVLAAVRFGTGSPVWGVVFTVAAGVNVGLSVHEGRVRHRSAREDAPPQRAELVRAWHSCSGSLRRWRVFAGVATALGVVLLFVTPGLAVVAAAAALFCLFRARRTRRHTGALHRTLHGGAPTDEAVS